MAGTSAREGPPTLGAPVHAAGEANGDRVTYLMSEEMFVLDERAHDPPGLAAPQPKLDDALAAEVRRLAAAIAATASPAQTAALVSRLLAAEVEKGAA